METRFSLFIADSRCLACTYRAKFVEVSVGINHNVDELLAGILTQIRLKKEQNSVQVSITIDLSTLFFFFDILFLFPFLWQQFFFCYVRRVCGEQATGRVLCHLIVDCFRQR